MDTMQWLWLGAALFVILCVLALIANVRMRRGQPSVNPWESGKDPSPGDGAIDRDRDLDLERDRDNDFRDGSH